MLFQLSPCLSVCICLLPWVILPPHSLFHRTIPGIRASSTPRDCHRALLALPVYRRPWSPFQVAHEVHLPVPCRTRRIYSGDGLLVGAVVSVAAQSPKIRRCTQAAFVAWWLWRLTRPRFPLQVAATVLYEAFLVLRTVSCISVPVQWGGGRLGSYAQSVVEFAGRH